MKKIITSICIVASTLSSVLAQHNTQLSEQQLRVVLKERKLEYAKDKAEADAKYYAKVVKGNASTQKKLSSLLTTGNEQDCNSAIAVCQNSYSQAQSYTGNGTINDIPAGSSCLGDNEKNSVWYRFTTNNSGVLDFDINPNNTVDDYDWALYDLTGKNCADIASGAVTPIRCNYSATNGSTGLSSSASNPTEGAGGPNQSTTLNTTVGKSYVLIVSNYSSTSSGYQLNFTGTAQAFDNTPPSIASLVSACGATSLQVNLNEPVLCSSISATDFVVTVLGVNYTVSAASGVNCGTATSQILLTVSPNLPTNLTDSIKVKIVLGTDGNTLIDQCGNAMPINTIKSFTNSPSNGNVPLTITPNDTLCSGGEVTITAPPALSYTWSTGATTQSITAIVNSTTTFVVTMPNGVCGNSQGTMKVVTVTSPATIAFTVPTIVCVNQSFVINNTSSVTTCDGNGTEICDDTQFLTGCSIFSSCDPTAATNWSSTLLTNTWSFGDGGVNGYSTAVLPGTHTYSDTGLYTISYIVNVPPAQIFGISITDGCTSEVTHQVRVVETPNAAWSSPGVVCGKSGALYLKPLTVDTTGTFACATCPIGALSNGVFHPDSIQGALPQQFVISYTVVNSTCNDVKFQTIVVNGKDSADFQLPSSVCQSAHKINLDTLVNGTIGGSWAITTLPTANCKIDTAMGISYLNLDSTVFAVGVDTATVQIRYVVGSATDSCGADTAYKSILILRTPNADFVTPDVCQTSNGVFLNPLAVDPTLIYTGIGTNSLWVRAGLVKQVPANSGNYYLLDSAVSGPIFVKHITTNIVGGITCKDSVIKNINVNITPKINAASASITNATCNKINGSITDVQALPIVGPTYTYQWYTGQDTTAPATIIVGASSDSLLTKPVGYYTINVMNGACRAKQTFEIKSVRVPVVSGAPFYYDKLCTSGLGQILPNNVQFLNPPVNYTVTDNMFNDLTGFPLLNQNIMDTNNVKGLQPGTYYVVFSDNSTCVDTFKIVINATTTNALATTGSTTPAVCTANNGAVSGVTLKYPPASSANINWINTGNNATVSNTLNPTALAPGTYKLYVTDQYGCTDSTVKTITQTFDSVYVNKGTSAPTICTATNGSITGITIKNPTAQSITWVNTSNVSIANTLNLTNVGTGTYKITVVDAFGCVGTFTKTVNLQIDSVFSNKGITSSAICTAANGSITGVTMNNIPAQTIAWVNASNIVVGNSLDLAPIAAGTYKLTAVDAFGCTTTLTKTVGVTTDNVFINKGAATFSICGKPFADINNIVIKNSPAQSIVWHNQANQVFTNTAPVSLQNVNAGVYTVIVLDKFGCKDSVKYNVVDSTYAYALFGTNVKSGLEALPVSFTNTATNNIGTVYNWNFGDGNDSVAYSIDHTFTTHGTYTVLLTVTDKFGCVDTQSVVINVFEKFDPRVPNVFTPNGDNKNDVFKVFGNGIKSIEYNIFDRWGKRVYEGTNIATGWDGSGQHDGTYYYVIKVAATDNLQTQELKGYIQLLK